MPVWLEYVQFSIGGMGQQNGVKRIRETFDRALTACGLHVSKGASLWEAYREFENAILAGLLVSTVPWYWYYLVISTLDIAYL